MPEHDRETDVAVIGGGPAGYVAAIRASQQDLDVTLVERERVGGSCLNHGCIPSKALISATDLAHRVREADRMGIDGDPTVDMAGVVRWKDRIVTRLTKGVEALCSGNDVELIAGTGTFRDEETLMIEPVDEGDSITLAFEHAIIATGSRPVELPHLPFATESVWDSRQALAASSAPDRLAVIGAGYIGMELAGVFSKAGSDVTVIELLDAVLPQYDAELTEPVADRAADLGIEFRLGERVVGFDRLEDGSLILELATAAGDGADPQPADAVLVAVGREPVSDTVKLGTTGIEPADDGTVPTDRTGETDVSGIYAVGDVTGDPMLAHVGMTEGIAASEAIAGVSDGFGHAAIPEVVFTDPEIAIVGQTAAEAEAAGREPLVGEFPLRASGRAMTMNQTDGFVRVVADEETERVLGGAVVGAEASELIGELGLAVELEATLPEVAGTIHAHPTLAEGIVEACELALGQPIHFLDRRA